MSANVFLVILSLAMVLHQTTGLFLSDSFDGTCIKDSWSRVLKHQRKPDSSSNTPENCGKYCLGKGYKYSGVQYRNQCFCGNTAPSSSTIAPKKECSYQCPGDKKQLCGGFWRMNVHETSKFSSKAEGQQEGESCGSCYCPPNFTAGQCVEGLTCVRNQNIPDSPGVCTKLECPTGWSEFQSKCYKIFEEKKSWDEAQDICRTEGSNLATIDSSNTNEFVEELLVRTPVEYPWIGAYLVSAELKEWKWIDGTPFEFENWDIDQPIHNPAEGCVEFVNGKWHDFPCDFPRAFICQKTNALKTVTRSGYSYQYYPYNKQRFEFKVKGKTEAVIGFDSDENDSDLYEIVIGGWGNSLSMVRRGKQGPNLGTGTVDKGPSAGQKGWTETPNILSPTEFRGFWITTERVNTKLYIKVGREGDDRPFMTGTDVDPLNIRKVALSAFTKDPVTFIF